MFHHIRGKCVDRPEDLPAFLHLLHVQPKMPMQNDHHFDAIQRIQTDTAVTEQIGIIGDRFGGQTFQGQIFDDEPFEFCLDLFQRSVVGSVQRTALLFVGKRPAF